MCFDVKNPPSNWFFGDSFVDLHPSPSLSRLLSLRFVLRCSPEGNGIGPQGAAELAGALKVNGTLKKLYLGCQAASDPFGAFLTSTVL